MLYLARYLENDPEVIEAIQAFGESFQLKNNSWQFKLKDFHQFCNQQIPSIENLSYPLFKQLLYQNPTNQLLKSNGGKFEVLLNSGQIEKTIYEGYEVVLWPDDMKEKDINDMILAGKTKEDIQTIIEKNSYQGNMAMIRFATWRRRNA